MKLIFTTTIFISILFSSCIAYQTGGISSNASGTNYRFEDLAFGEAHANRFIMFGGMSKDALLLEAKRELFTARPLLENEEYANFTYDFKHSFIFGFSRTKVSLSADVIKRYLDTPINRYLEIYVDKMLKVNQTDSLFFVGDSVYTKGFQSGIILSNKNIKWSKVLFTNSYDQLVTKLFPNHQLYNKKGAWSKFQVGERIYFSYDLEQQRISGTVVGVNKKKVLIKTDSGEFQDFKKKMIRIIETDEI